MLERHIKDEKQKKERKSSTSLSSEFEKDLKNNIKEYKSSTAVLLSLSRSSYLKETKAFIYRNKLIVIKKIRAKSEKNQTSEFKELNLSAQSWHTKSITVFFKWAADYLQHDFLLQHRLKVKSDQWLRAEWSLNRTHSSFWVVDDFINIFHHTLLDFHLKDFEIEKLSQFKSESEQINSILATLKISFSFFTMTNVKMFKFAKSKEEDLNIFIVWVKFAFLLYKEQFDTLKI